MISNWPIKLKCNPSGIKPENAFKINGVRNTDKIVAISVSKNVSLRNCIMSCFFELPIVLRIPISLALCVACAVVRFIKLMHPKSNKKAATASKPNKVGLSASGKSHLHHRASEYEGAHVRLFHLDLSGSRPKSRFGVGLDEMAATRMRWYWSEWGERFESHHAHRCRTRIYIEHGKGDERGILVRVKIEAAAAVGTRRSSNRSPSGRSRTLHRR